MYVSHKEKKIRAYQWERITVCNFIAYVLKGQEGWSVEFLDDEEATVTKNNRANNK